ncbi:MAG: hypothetical protein JW836_06785 [Deltaproteobacteria bacterium]|nr:hypothetical protein [Deltaproteobacteria bacterium]
MRAVCVPGRWFKYSVLFMVGSLFLLLGIQLLIASCRLNNPFSFVMTFFASNFIIFICVTVVIAFAMRMTEL